MKRTALHLIVYGFLVVSFIHCKKDCQRPLTCNLEPDSGPCLANFTKYYYDKDEKKCRPFTWGGCDGTVPFQTMEEYEACECR